ncbi:MAG: hypothetical protein ACK443_09110 [Methylococcaceae bacterium]|jgi:hypothetical protein
MSEKSGVLKAYGSDSRVGLERDGLRCTGVTGDMSARLPFQGLVVRQYAPTNCDSFYHSIPAQGN